MHNPPTSTRSTRTRAVIAAAIGIVLLGATPVMASSRPGITVREGATANSNYPAFSGVYPGHQVEEGEPTPDMCSDSGPLRAGCDVIPLKIITPGSINASDDWLVTIRVNWTQDNANTEDLDIFLYDNQQIGKRSDPGSTKYTKVGQSASSAKPEIIKVLTPDLGDYNLVVAHFSGISSGYNVQGSIAVEKFVSPVEALDDRSPSGGTSNRDDDVVTPSDQSAPGPVDFSADAFDGGGGIDALTPPSALPEVAILPDADLDTGVAPITSSFAAPPQLAPGQLAASAPAKPVPVPVIAFWFLVVPALLIGGGWMVASRRSRASFSFG